MPSSLNLFLMSGFSPIIWRTMFFKFLSVLDWFQWKIFFGLTLLKFFYLNYGWKEIKEFFRILIFLNMIDLIQLVSMLLLGVIYRSSLMDLQFKIFLEAWELLFPLSNTLFLLVFLLFILFCILHLFKDILFCLFVTFFVFWALGSFHSLHFWKKICIQQRAINRTTLGDEYAWAVRDGLEIQCCYNTIFQLGNIEMWGFFSAHCLEHTLWESSQRNAFFCWGGGGGGRSL